MEQSVKRRVSRPNRRPPSYAARSRLPAACAHADSRKSRDPLPTVSLQATFTLSPGVYFPVNNDYRLQSPTFMHAAEVCGVQLP